MKLINPTQVDTQNIECSGSWVLMAARLVLPECQQTLKISRLSQIEKIVSWGDLASGLVETGLNAKQ